MIWKHKPLASNHLLQLAARQLQAGPLKHLLKSLVYLLDQNKIAQGQLSVWSSNQSTHSHFSLSVWLLWNHEGALSVLNVLSDRFSMNSPIKFIILIVSVGRAMSRIAYIFLSSGSIPSADILSPKNVISCTPKWHLAWFSFTKATFALSCPTVTPVSLNVFACCCANSLAWHCLSASKS